MAGVTILALASYWFIPEENWLPSTRIGHFLESDGAAVFETGKKEVTVTSREGED